MGKLKALATTLVLLLNITTLFLTSTLAQQCSCPTPQHPPKLPPKHPPKVKPPKHPKPPAVKPPKIPKPPSVKPPPPYTPAPVVPTPAQGQCPADGVKLAACVDVLGGLVHIGTGGAKEACCPVLQGVADLDAALCLCTTIKAKLLNINILIPIALQLLIDCGKYPPSGFHCPP